MLHVSTTNGQEPQILVEDSQILFKVDLIKGNILFVIRDSRID